MSLRELWYASLALAIISVAVMLLLVGRRVVQARLDRRRRALRAAASSALIQYLDGSATAAQVQLAAGGHSGIIGDLIIEMREIMRGEGAAQLVELAAATRGLEFERRRLRHRNANVRAQAVSRLAIYGQAAVPLLQGALRDRDAGVRTAAAIELTTLDGAPPLATLAELMRVGVDASSEDLRRIFRRAVAAEPRAAATLLEDEWTADALRVLLLDGLGHAGAFALLPAISEMAHHSAAEVRMEALRALADLGHPWGADAALGALADPDWQVRAAAANCVRRIGASDGAPALEALLDDEQWWVRFRAAEALSTLPDGRGRLSKVAGRGGRAGQVAQLVLAERATA